VANLPPNVSSDRHGDGSGPDQPPPAGTPRWVIRFWLVALVLVLLVVLHLTGGGFRGHGGP